MLPLNVGSVNCLFSYMMDEISLTTVLTLGHHIFTIIMLL